MNLLTKEQAIALADSNWWEGLPAKEVARFQLFEELLCMPFDLFQEAVEKALGRPVWTHEFASSSVERLRKELLGEEPSPTFVDILNLIPADKRLLIFTE